MTANNLWITIGSTLTKAKKDYTRRQVNALSETAQKLLYQMNELADLHAAEYEQLTGEKPHGFTRKKQGNPTAKMINAVKEIARDYSLTPHQWEHIVVQIRIHLVPGLSPKKNGNLAHVELEEFKPQ